MTTKRTKQTDTEDTIKYKYRKLKSDILKLITSKGLLENTDTVMIDELIFNYKIIDGLKKELLGGNCINNVRKDDGYPLLQTSAYMSVYNNCLKNILAISRQLGITPSERAKLGLNKVSPIEEDGF